MNDVVCSQCGQNEITNTENEKAKNICDSCNILKSLTVIYNYCVSTDKRNPYAIANEIMQDPAIQMHGPEHHVLIGSALLTAFHNCGGKITLPESLEIMRERGSQVPRGICGYWGSCGSAVSAGIFMSIITDNMELFDEGWGLSNLLTSKCLKNIAELGGPRCCKRDGFLAIQTAVPFVAEHFNVHMEMPIKMECQFDERCNECTKNRCPFYTK